MCLLLAQAGCSSSSKPQREVSIGGGDASLGAEDAGAPADGGEIVIGVPTCNVAPNALNVPIEAGNAGAWHARQLGDALHLVYEVPTCAGEAIAGQRLDYVQFSSTGDFKTKRDVLGDEAACHRELFPVLGGQSKDQSMLYFVSDRAMRDDLYGQALGDMAAATLLSKTSAATFKGVEHPAEASFGTRALLAYVNLVEQGDGTSTGQLVTREPNGTEHLIFEAKGGARVIDVALTSLDAARKSGGLVAFVVEAGDAPVIVLQGLDDQGAPKGSPTVLSAQVNAKSNVGLTILPKGADDFVIGAVVYGVGPTSDRNEIRLRAIGADGTVGDEVEVTSGVLNVHGVGVAQFAAGYVLVYRVVTGSQPTLHAKMLDYRGNPASFGELLLADVDAEGDAPQVFVTSDGRITTVFSERSGSDHRLRVLRATCDP